MLVLNIVLAITVVLLGACLLFQRRQLQNSSNEAASNGILTLQKEMAEIRAGVSERMAELSKNLQTQLSQNSRFLQTSQQGYQEAVGRVNQQLGQIQEATRTMQGIGREIASLQDILRAPKLRGGMGELFLEELLRQILPQEHYEMQYAFQDGSKVDAVIYLGQAIIPVDAKFPLENFRRMSQSAQPEEAAAARKGFIQDVKKHVDDIASKYILPQEQTYDFALMYIPAENVYYETIIKEDAQQESIASYALRKRVIPVSPNSFYAYLQALVRGLKGLRIERSAQMILQGIGQLEMDIERLVDEFEKIGSHLNNAKSAFDKTHKRIDKLKLRVGALDQDKELKSPETLVAPFQN